MDLPLFPYQAVTAWTQRLRQQPQHFPLGDLQHLSDDLCREAFSLHAGDR